VAPESLGPEALVVAGENSRPLLENTLSSLLAPGLDIKEFFKNFATLTLGSGGAAMILGDCSDNPRAPRLKNMVSLSDPGSNHLCRGSLSGMQTDAVGLLKAGVELAYKTFQEGRKSFGWSPGYFDLIICHQVSQVNTERFCQSLGLSWDRIYKTYPEYGNMGPVAVPFAFDMAMEEGLIGSGARVALVGIGSGLACAMMEIEIP
jgi:3-oxoacyl-[acyl-carrier-protein] synthase-3